MIAAADTSARRLVRIRHVERKDQLGADVFVIHPTVCRGVEAAGPFIGKVFIQMDVEVLSEQRFRVPDNRRI